MASAAEVMKVHPGPVPVSNPRMSTTVRREEVVIVDAAAGWRGEKILYQCACVAAL
jgi:hypothetical protein